jgi:hypothetical protein
MQRNEKGKKEKQGEQYKGISHYIPLFIAMK